MRIGLHYRATDLAMPVVELAQAAAERGFGSLYLPEHTHVPVALPDSRPALGHGARREVDTSLREIYRRVFDPYVALAFVAARTDLVIATCIAEVAQHDPIALAKTVATLDHLSGGGRLVLGVGTGWDDREFENHGHPRRERLARFREGLRVLRAIWDDEQAEFAGEFHRFGPLYSWPKPVRPIPVLLGCRPRPTGFDIIAEQCDGWIPQDFDAGLGIGPDLDRLNERWAAAGRPGRPVVTLMQSIKEPDALRRDLDAQTDLGVDEIVVDVPSLTAAGLLPLLDSLSRTYRLTGAG